MAKPIDNQAREEWFRYGEETEHKIAWILASQERYRKFIRCVRINPQKAYDKTAVDYEIMMADGRKFLADLKFEEVPFYSIKYINREPMQWPQEMRDLMDRLGYPYQDAAAQFVPYWNWFAINLKHWPKYSDDTIILAAACWNDNGRYAKKNGIVTPEKINGIYAAPFWKIKKMVNEEPAAHVYKERLIKVKGEPVYPRTERELYYAGGHGNSAMSNYVNITKMTRIGDLDPAWLVNPPPAEVDPTWPVADEDPEIDDFLATALEK